MRVGLIADVHGNAHALEAVLASMREAGVDEALEAGGGDRDARSAARDSGSEHKHGGGRP